MTLATAIAVAVILWALLTPWGPPKPPPPRKEPGPYDFDPGLGDEE